MSNIIDNDCELDNKLNPSLIKNQIHIPMSYIQENNVDLYYINYCNYLNTLYYKIILYLNKNPPIFNNYYSNLQSYETTYLILINKNTLYDISILLKLLNFNKFIYLSKEGEPISALMNKTTYTTIKHSQTKIGYVYCLETYNDIDGFLLSF
jgi:hypothetical protein